jgi:biotin-(acetyl-CoA carboxylase) ligase
VAPELETGVGLRRGVSRLEALEHLVPALRAATAASRHLGEDELARWRARDIALGRRLDTPAVGVAAGISSSGELLIEGADGIVTRHRTGSLTFADPLACS